MATAKLGLAEGSKPFDLVFHGGSGSLLEEIHEALDYGVVKMNVDTDTQYAFTRPIAGAHVHQLRRRAEGRRRGRQQEGLRPALLPEGRRGRHGRAGGAGLREPRSTGTTLPERGCRMAGHDHTAIVHGNLLGPEPTLLPVDPAAAELDAGHRPGRGRGGTPDVEPRLGGAGRARARTTGETDHRLRLRAHRLPPRARPAASLGLEGLRPGAVVARAQPGLPAGAGAPSSGPPRRSARPTRRSAAAVFLADSDPAAAAALGLG